MVVRRIRGIVGAALIWAVLWLPLGVLAGILRYSLAPPNDLVADITAPPERPPAFPIIADTAVAFMVWGAVVGVLFALVLIGAERKRTIDELRPRRLAIWGALSAVGLPLSVSLIEFARSSEGILTWQFCLTLAVTAGFGAVCSAGMLRLAQGGRPRAISQ